MSTPEVPITGFSLGKHFNRSYNQPLICYSIIHPTRMLICKIPKGKIIIPMLYQMLWQVYHKSESHVHNGLDSAFGLWIFMLIPNSGETMGLALAFKIIAVLICHKHTVITMVMGDLSTCLFPQPFFKYRFYQHSLIFSEWDLILNPNQTRRGIIIYGTAVKSILVTFANISRWKSYRREKNELICEKSLLHNFL